MQAGTSGSANGTVRASATLGAPLLESGLDGVVLRLPGTHARTLETREFRFRLGAPKAYRQI